MPNRSDMPLALVAMSGGVDSSVAAAILAASGDHDVAGITLRLADDPDTDGERARRTCCAPDDVADARRVAARLGIAHYVLAYTEVFEREVVTPFVAAYASGRTPNPCVLCNARVKFDPLLRRAEGLGAEILATGHYARVDRDAAGRYHLRRAADPAKDQSYFLYGLSQEALARVRFPLGGLTKDVVRQRARALGLVTADKPDSQEICFVGRRGYAEVVARRGGGQPPGEVVHLDGTVLGRHEGVHRYTVGQRRGLGIAAAEPLYVIGVDARRREVVVGPRAALERSRLRLDQVTWVGVPPTADCPLTVQVRHRHAGVPGRVANLDADRCELDLAEPVSAAAPGQAVVLYDADEVVGGGTLVEAAA